MVIPEKIEKNSSRGEQILLHKFRTEESSQKFCVLHSLFIAKHIKTVSGELDFLVLAPGKGIFALEVKHGDVDRKEGVWIYTNRYGQSNTSLKGPFRQVSDTMHSLRKYILDKVSNNQNKYDRYSKLLFGYGVVFSGINETPDNMGPESEPWMIYTRDLMRRSPVSHYIDNLSRGWKNKFENHQWFNPNESVPTNKECEELVKLLRGDFEYKYSELNNVIDAEYRIEQFTKEQFEILAYADNNARCLFEGDAGTGKTIMAIELAKKEISKGKKVGLFSFNKALGDKISKDLLKIGEEKKGSFFAGNLHLYMSQNSNAKMPENSDEWNDFFTEQLPLEFLFDSENMSEQEKFDIIILDEAQDLITPNYLEVIDSILVGGVKDGFWYMFGDFSNQAIYLNEPSKCLELIRKRACFAVAPKLKINCRNTLQIATQNTLLTGVELPYQKSEMPNGEGISPFFPAINLGKKIDEIIDQLIKSVVLDKIIVLSPLKLADSGLESSKYIVDKKVQFSTIQAYKGLENTAVILTGFKEINTEQAQRLLYVGISRARLYLHIVLNRRLERDYQQLMQHNINKL